MANLTKAEFAERCGITVKNLATYEGRGKVIYTKAAKRSDERVNILIEPNKSFLAIREDRLASRTGKASKKEPLRLIRPLNKKEQSDESEEYDEPSEGSGLETKKLTKQIEKMEKEIEKLTLSNSKSKGEVIPVGLIDGLFLQERQSILTESRNVLTDILTIFAKRRDLSAFERTDVSAEFTDRLNEMMKRAADATARSVKNILSEYSVKKGVGERN